MTIVVGYGNVTLPAEPSFCLLGFGTFYNDSESNKSKKIGAREERENQKEVRNKETTPMNHQTFQFKHLYLIYKAWLLFFLTTAQMAMSTSTHVQGKRHRQLLAVKHEGRVKKNFIGKGSLPTLNTQVCPKQAIVNH